MDLFKSNKVKGLPVSRNIIMNRLYVGIDVQTRRDCCFAISNDNGLLQESGWFIDFSSCLPGPKDMLDAFLASVTVREFIHGIGMEVGK